MSPGPILVVKSPACSTPLKFTTIASGNSFGAVFWTDGKHDAPMLPEQPPLRKHPTENALVWLDKDHVIETLWDDSAEGQEAPWKNLPYAVAPTEQDYFDALSSGIADTEEKLRYIRIRLWWTGNDPIRESRAGTLPPPHIENLSRLALMLPEEDPQHRLMKVEVFRELGFFEDGLRLLERDYPAELREAVSFLVKLCHTQDARVGRFPW